MDDTSHEYPVGAKDGAKLVGSSVSGFKRAVATGLLPPPFYPTPKVARWWPSELRAAVNSRRMLPREAKEARRMARLSARQGEP
jgi:hypothetical protein